MHYDAIMDEALEARAGARAESALEWLKENEGDREIEAAAQKLDEDYDWDDY
jgi:hypothetical protein